MKSQKFIQFFTEDGNPILNNTGIIDYNKNLKKINSIRKVLKDKNLIPPGATHFAIHQTMLKSIIKLSENYPV